ncbi:MAG: amidohydrolase family protein [Desulfobacterales bacterium]
MGTHSETVRRVRPTADSRFLLKNGFIVDGTGRPGYVGNVLIRGEKIEAVSRESIDIDCETMDCSGLVISPGFIDAHSHMDWILCIEGFERLKTPYTDQGCTTFVTGNCGYSPGGYRKNSPYKNMLQLGADRGFDLYWDTMDELFAHLERTGLSHNIVHFAGHGTSQASMRGLDPKPLTGEELNELLFLLEESMDQGAAGVSFGLGYEPGIFFPKDHIMSVARLVKKKNKLITVHGRAYSCVSGFYEDVSTPHNVLSLREMIEIAEESGVRLQYSHLMFAGSKSHPTYAQCLEELDDAVSRGVDVKIDTYPYHCGNSIINVILPPWFLANVPSNYHNPEAVAGVEKGLEAMSQVVGFGYNDIQLTYAGHSEYDPYNGMFIGEISQKRNMRPAQVVLELSEKTNGRARILNHNYSNMEVVDALIRHPDCLFMTDAVVSMQGVQNPASFGAFPLLLQYSRDRKLLSLEEAVYKMTGATAERFNIQDRGFIRAKTAADITVFDWENIKDNNTVEQTDRAPTGIEAVFMNGRQVKKDGKVDGAANAGVVIRN